MRAHGHRYQQTSNRAASLCANGQRYLNALLTRALSSLLTPVTTSAAGDMLAEPGHYT